MTVIHSCSADVIGCRSFLTDKSANTDVEVKFIEIKFILTLPNHKYEQQAQMMILGFRSFNTEP